MTQVASSRIVDSDKKNKNIIDESNAYLIIVGNCGLSGVIQDGVLENNIL